MTKLRAEAAEAKVVLIEWNTPESINPDTKEAIGKWCFETSGNDANIAAMPRPCKFPRWNIKSKLKEPSCNVPRKVRDQNVPFGSLVVRLPLYMFVVSGHLYRPLLLSQSWELRGKIFGGFGTHPLTFFGAGLSILVFF